MTLVDLEAPRADLDSDERRLWAAVVAQVVRDLFLPDTLVTQASRRRAMSWLTTAHGDLARDRVIACTFAGIDGDALRNRVVAILDGKASIELVPGVRSGETALAEARAMWRDLNLPPTRRPAPEPTARNDRIPQHTIKTRPAAVVPEPQPTPVAEGDAFFVCGAGHIRASRSWRDGEVSTLLGPLPPPHTALGRLLWEIAQTGRVGWNKISYLGNPNALVRELKSALPSCEILWVRKDERLPKHRLGYALRIYPKQAAQAA
jgi:hypothetical protein